MKNKDQRKKKIKLKLRCNLTNDERIQIGNQMAEAINDIERLENDRKSIADDFKARISAREAQLNSDKNKLQTGYEYRDVDCEVTFGSPKPGQKTVTRLDEKKTVEVTNMTDEEKQECLPLDEVPS